MVSVGMSAYSSIPDHELARLPWLLISSPNAGSMMDWRIRAVLSPLCTKGELILPHRAKSARMEFTGTTGVRALDLGLFPMNWQDPVIPTL